jgi:hypothetical protein
MISVQNPELGDRVFFFMPYTIMLCQIFGEKMLPLIFFSGCRDITCPQGGLNFQEWKIQVPGK